MIIRTANPSDAYQLYLSIDNCADEFPDAYVDYMSKPAAERAAELLSDLEDPDSFGIVAEESGEIVGHLLGYFKPHTVFLWTVYVNPKVYGNNTIVKIWDEFSEMAAKRGYSTWEANTDPKTYKFLRSITDHKSKQLDIIYHRLRGAI
jgi:hypothetical protein